jgi:hypothetical protein
LKHGWWFPKVNLSNPFARKSCVIIPEKSMKKKNGSSYKRVDKAIADDEKKGRRRKIDLRQACQSLEM